MRGISLYLQGTQIDIEYRYCVMRYIPVPTGNSNIRQMLKTGRAVYPCTYRELYKQLVMLFINLRYIPVPTGNSIVNIIYGIFVAVYPCTYRELKNK